MTWRQYLQSRTRRPAFLWRIVIAILVVGVAVGIAVEGRFAAPPEAARQLEQAVAPPDDPLAAMAESGQWLKLWWAIPEVVLQRTRSPGPVVLALFSGACWLGFCAHAAQVKGPRDPLAWLLPAALILGGASVWPTHFMSLWLESQWNLRPSVELAAGLRYCVLGIGLPEELAKLACFVPLLPPLLWIRGDLPALITAGCVGLGFAVVENMNYFESSAGADVVGRFLTANPLHMTLTGLAGLAVYRAARDVRGWGPPAIATVALVILAHGLYDASIILGPALGDVALLGTIIFAAVVYQFFRELRQLRPRRPEVISLSATFLAGASAVTAASFIYLSGVLGFGPACDAIAMSVLGMSLMAYLFLREMPDTMVTV